MPDTGKEVRYKIQQRRTEVYCRSIEEGLVFKTVWLGLFRTAKNWKLPNAHQLTFG